MNPILNSIITGNENGTPLLIIHGFLGMSDNWKTFANQMAERQFQVHAVDLRNHGKSFHSADWSYDFMVDDIRQYMQAQQIEKAHVLGHSMGGKLAMIFASKHPEFIDKLVVADIAPRYYKPHHDDILNGLAAVDFSQKPSRQEVDEILQKYIPDFGTRQFLLKSLYWIEPGQLAFRFNLPVFLAIKEAVGTQVNPEARFDMPTLFVRGGESKYIQERDEADIQQQFSNVRIETIAGAGHWLHAEKPAEFYQIVSSFLS